MGQMIERPAGTRLDLAALTADLRIRGIDLSDAMALGLGAGLYFEYYSQSGRSPSHYFTGHNRRLPQNLHPRALRFGNGDDRQLVREALRANAEAMDLDRSNYTAIMGMELLVEDFENWESAPDVLACAEYGAREIRASEALYRGVYLRFLEEASVLVPDTLSLMPMLGEVVAEWDALALILHGVARGEDGCTFARAARVLRRVALLEEHFWGEIINSTE